MKKSNLFRSIIIILTFLLAAYGNGLLSKVTDISITSGAGKVVYFYSWWVIPVIITVGLLFGFRNILKELRIQKGFLTGLVFAFITVLPMFISSAVIGSIDKELTLTDLLHYTVIGGFMEELLFRGFLFGILFRKLNWGFIPASLPGAIIFGLGHLYQASDPVGAFSIFMVTFTGALWFAWLFIEWEENLWVPILLHIFMNLSWTLFNVGENAAGDHVTNIFRVITIALTIAITIIRKKRKKIPGGINKRNLIVNTSI